jgi:hypothetical protein
MKKWVEIVARFPLAGQVAQEREVKPKDRNFGGLVIVVCKRASGVWEEKKGNW